MLKIDFDTETINAIADALKPAVQESIKNSMDELKDERIRMLSRKDIMDIFNCEKSKASYIMSLLPKVPDVGHHCVPEHWLRKWIDENVEENGIFPEDPHFT